MAYLIIAVGALMALAGAYEIYIGDAIISVERGWSAFISGNVLVAGGVLTIAVGLAIRAIQDLKRVLVPSEAGAAARALPTMPAEQPAEPDPIELGAAAETPTIAAAPPLTHLPIPSADLEPAPAMEAYRDEPTSRHASLMPRSHGLASTTEPNLAADLRLRPSLDVEPVATPAMDDWLERSFADLDHDTSVDAARAAATRAHAHQDRDLLLPASTGEAHAQVASRSAQTATVEEHLPTIDGKTFADPEPPISSVIGRYEADGTSYIMYADGSIEAQSATGIYRFASMAELKTFIET